MDLLTRLLEHDACMTRRLLEHARTLSQEEYSRPMDIGPGCVRDTLEHVIGAVEHWAAQLAGQPRVRPATALDPESLLARHAEAERTFATIARRVVAEGRLDETLTFEYDGTRYTFTRGTAIVHVVTHGMHHRAQVINMLRRLGRPVSFEGDAVEWELDAKIASAVPLAAPD